MRKLIHLGVVCLLYSCGASKIVQSDMAGEFYKKQTANKTISVSYSLNLRPDSTFVFSIKSQDANPKCEGSWELNRESVYLKCNESDDIGEILSSGNMPDKEHKLEVINRNRIKFKNVVLTRR